VSGLRAGASMPAQSGLRPAPRPELEAPWAPRRPQTRLVERVDGTVDNLEWIDLPAGHAPLDLAALERRYFAWVPRLTAGLVTPRWVGAEVHLGIEPLGWPIAIRLEPPLVREGREGERDGERTRPIAGGMLARRGGTFGFELRRRPEGTRVVVAVRRLAPRLPRWLYRRFQVRMHVRSTLGFLREVAQRADPQRATP
jgi:hypothetical protein